MMILPQTERRYSRYAVLQAQAQLELMRRAGEAKEIWEPFPGPQTMALKTEADELFYGGAAGGGKTDLLLGLALTRHKVSLILRKEYKNLAGAGGIVERSRQILSTTRARYNTSEHVWRDIPGDRLLEFDGIGKGLGGLDKHQGKAKDLLGIDEAPQFTEAQITYLTIWNRTVEEGHRVRVVLTGNPPTSSSGAWIIKRYAPWLDIRHPNPAKPGELRWFAPFGEVDGPEPIEYQGEIVIPTSRTFIPARVDDNPTLMRTDYKQKLMSIQDPRQRAKFLYGDFSGCLEDSESQVIPTAWIMAAMERWKHIGQPGGGQTAIGVDVARGGDDYTVFAPLKGVWFAPIKAYHGSKTPDGESVAQLLEGVIEGDPEIYVDVIGWGSSAYERIRDRFGGMAHPVNFGEGAGDAKDISGKRGFFKKRDHAYWMLREALDPENGYDPCLPDDPQLMEDLASPTYQEYGDKIKIEPKDSIKERLGRSPDKGDAVVYAWYHYAQKIPWYLS